MTTARSLLPTLASNIPYLNGQQGPKLAILIVTRATQSIVQSYAAYSSALQGIYAAKQGYGYLLTSREYNSTEEYDYFPKIKPILETWDTEAAHVDYIVWMDSGRYRPPPPPFPLPLFVY